VGNETSFEKEITYLCKPSELIVDGTNSLLNGFFERSPDAHNLTNTLHAAAEEPADAVKLLQIPAWYLDYNIIQARLEACTGDFSDRIFNLIEWNAEAQLGSNECERVSGSL
jgi:hypothetical protein